MRNTIVIVSAIALAVVLLSCVLFGVIGSMATSRAVTSAPAAQPAAASPSAAPTNTSRRPEGFDFSPEAQQKRKAVLEGGVKQGLWTKVEMTNGVPKVWVTPTFLSLDEKAQYDFLNAVYAYYVGESENFGRGPAGAYWDPLVPIRDNGSPAGERLGTFNPVEGWKR